MVTVTQVSTGAEGTELLGPQWVGRHPWRRRAVLRDGKV